MSQFEPMQGSLAVFLTQAPDGKPQASITYHIDDDLVSLSMSKSDVGTTLQRFVLDALLEEAEGERLYAVPTKIEKEHQVKQLAAAASDAQDALQQAEEAGSDVRPSRWSKLSLESLMEWKTDVEKLICKIYESTYQGEDEPAPTSPGSSQPLSSAPKLGWQVFAGNESFTTWYPHFRLQTGTRVWSLRGERPKYPGHVEFSISPNEIVAPAPSV